MHLALDDGRIKSQVWRRREEEAFKIPITDSQIDFLTPGPMKEPAPRKEERVITRLAGMGRQGSGGKSWEAEVARQKRGGGRNRGKGWVEKSRREARRKAKQKAGDKRQGTGGRSEEKEMARQGRKGGKREAEAGWKNQEERLDTK